MLEDERKCYYLDWVDQEWPQSLKMFLAKIWSMYEEENRCRLRETVVNAEEYLKMRDKMRKVENELRFLNQTLLRWCWRMRRHFPSWLVQNRFLLN